MDLAIHNGERCQTCAEWLGLVADRSQVIERPIVIADAQKKVAEFFRVPMADLLGECRTPSIVRARHVAMFVAREVTSASTTELGKAFGGRHSGTAGSALEKIGALRKTDAGLDQQIERLVAEVRRGA